MKCDRCGKESLGMATLPVTIEVGFGSHMLGFSGYYCEPCLEDLGEYLEGESGRRALEAMLEIFELDVQRALETLKSATGDSGGEPQE